MNKGYVADLSALCGAERITFSEGKQKGVDAVRIYNGKIDATIVLDRAMDIFRLFYKGKPVSYISKNGLVSPRLTETNAYGFLNSFDAGFLYTCGLDNIGAPVEKNGAKLSQHGCLSYIPAENVKVDYFNEGDNFGVKVSGEMKYTALFGHKLVLKREISLLYNSDEIKLNDEVRNENFVEDEYMIMYHMNFGYPLLSETATLKVDSYEVKGVSDVFNVEKSNTFEAPSPGRAEEVYLHKINAGSGKKVELKNGDFKAEIYFDQKEFPYFTQWKSMASGDYVLGLEPNTTPSPEKEYRKIGAGESAFHSVKVVFSDK